jgi:hypothetical protein
MPRVLFLVISFCLLVGCKGSAGGAMTNPGDQWAVATAEEDGNEVIYRFRSAVPAGIVIRDYPHLVNIYWQIEESHVGGVPTPDVNERMTDLEERLDTLEGPATGYMVLSITGSNRREWIWYVRDSEKYMERVNDVLGELPPFPIEFEVSDDPDWSTFQGLLRSVK